VPITKKNEEMVNNTGYDYYMLYTCKHSDTINYPYVTVIY